MIIIQCCATCKHYHYRKVQDDWIYGENAKCICGNKNSNCYIRYMSAGDCCDNYEDDFADVSIQRISSIS